MTLGAAPGTIAGNHDQDKLSEDIIGNESDNKTNLNKIDREDNRNVVGESVQGILKKPEKLNLNENKM